MIWVAVGAVIWTGAALLVWALCVAAARAEAVAQSASAGETSYLDAGDAAPIVSSLPGRRADAHVHGWLAALGTVLDADVGLDRRPVSDHARRAAGRSITVVIDAHDEPAVALTAHRPDAGAPFDATDRELLALAAKRLAALTNDARLGMPGAGRPRFIRPAHQQPSHRESGFDAAPPDREGRSGR